jgi:hypothetical protein
MTGLRLIFAVPGDIVVNTATMVSLSAYGVSNGISNGTYSSHTVFLSTTGRRVTRWTPKRQSSLRKLEKSTA